MVIPLWKTIMSAEETNERRVFFADKNNLHRPPRKWRKRQKRNRYNKKTKNTLQTLGVAFYALVSCDIIGDERKLSAATALKFIKN